MREKLDAFLASMGRGPTEDVEPFMHSRRFANWRATLADGEQLLLRVARMPEAHRGLLHEAAAHAKAAGTDVPIVQSYELIDPEVFGASASLSTWIPGSSGLGVLDSQPLAVPILCQAIGSLRRTLEEQTVGAFGMSVVDGRFVGIRQNWADEYLARVYDWRFRAEAVGASLGPLGDELLARVHMGYDAMSKVSQFCLVHGDLRPSNLVLDVTPPPERDQPPVLQLAGLVDWEFACMADPLLAFALPLELSISAMAHVLAGYGAEAAQAWQSDPDVLARLDAYAAGRVFQYLGLVVASQVEGGGATWGLGMDYAARLAEERAASDFTATRLEQIFAEEPPETVIYGEPGEPIRAVIRRALGRTTCRPVLGNRGFGPWVGALAAALRALDFPDEGWAKDGQIFLDGLGPEIAVRGFEPIADREIWMREIDAQISALPGLDAFALTTWWFGLTALDYIDWSVPDGVLRGLESQVQIQIHGAAPQLRGRDALLHSVLGLAAEKGLAAFLDRPEHEPAQRHRLDALAEAWEDLTVFGGETPADLGDHDWAGRGTPDHRAWVVPAVLLCIRELPELPVPLGPLIGAICG